MSSYEKNNYADVFYSIITAWKPVTVVELGVLNGYSTLAIGRALRQNKKNPGTIGHLDAYDLFEDYEFKHGNMADVQAKIDNEGLQEFITLNKGDAWEVHNKYADEMVYLLHVDLSNTGDTFNKTMELWDKKICVGGIILFEGGSEERDNVEWMIKHNKPSIKKAVETEPMANTKYVYGTYLKFPSLTMLLKKRRYNIYE